MTDIKYPILRFRTHANVYNLVLVALVLGIAVAPMAHAYDQYMIELDVHTWTTSGKPISVNIEEEDAKLYDLAKEAVNVWNQALQWFQDSYAPNSELYRFTIEQSGVVTIGFGLVYTSEHICVDYTCFDVATPCYDCTGVAEVYYHGAAIQSVRITVAPTKILDTLKSIDRAATLHTLTHELGHALGLGHTYLSQDLMYEYVDVGQAAASSPFPTTLDLYAVKVLADAGKKLSQVSLPSSIPYEVFPAKRQVELTAPSQVTSLSIDGASYPLGKVKLTLSVGSHTIAVLPTVEIDNGTRLVFMSWVGSDGSTTDEPTMLIELIEDVMFEAHYKTQYILIVKDTFGQAVASWHDAGASVKFVPPKDAKQTVTMNGVLGVLGGKWQLQGWTDNGKGMQDAESYVVLMNSPHTFATIYYADYTIPNTIMAVSASLALLVAVLFILRKRRAAPKSAGNAV